MVALVTLGLALTGCKDEKNTKPIKQVKKDEQPAIAKLTPRMQGEIPKKMREVASTPEMIAEGKRLFGTCAACHGDKARGRAGMGPRLNSKSFLQAASDDMLIRTISHGRAGTTMVPWRSQLTQSQIHSIVAYLRSLAPSNPAALNEKRLKGDLKTGAHLFRHICAACHGRAGGGYQETANGTGIGRRAFLTSVSNGYLRYVIKNGKDLTKMRPFKLHSKVAVANLTNKQIDDVIVYLRTRAW